LIKYIGPICKAALAAQAMLFPRIATPVIASKTCLIENRPPRRHNHKVKGGPAISSKCGNIHKAKAG